MGCAVVLVGRGDAVRKELRCMAFEPWKPAKCDIMNRNWAET